jgi:ABC-2 type transport system permease protein
MILLVARREVVDHLRSIRFLALCALTLLLLPLSAYVSAEAWRSRRAFSDALAQTRDARVATSRTDNTLRAGDSPPGVPWGWHSGDVASDEALRAIRAPAPLSVLALGADGRLPAYWQFGTEGVAAGPPLGGDDGADAAPADLTFVVQIVLGLLAILLGADAIPGEAESGLLRTVLANPVPRAHVVLGKYLGALLTLLVPLALGVPPALLVLRALDVPLGDRDGWPRALAFAAAIFLYLACMLALALAVSARSQRARTSLVVLLVAWVLIVLVVPRVGEILAASLRPVPPFEFVRRARAAATASLEAERASELALLWRRVAGTDDVPDGDLPPDLKRAYNAARLPIEEGLFRRKRTALATIDDAHDRAAYRQRAMASAIGHISPAATFAALAADLAGTGPRTTDRWYAQVRAHQQALEHAAFDRVFGVELFAPRLDRLRITWGPDPRDPADTPPSYADLPTFAYAPEPTSDALRTTLPGFLYLAALTALLLGAAIASFSRYEVQ